MTTETAVALRPSGRLAITEDQDYWTPEQYAGLKALDIKGATEGDLAVFFHYCRRTMLDPFSKQIYMIQRKVKARWQDDRGQWQERWVDKQTIQVAIDGFRVVRDRVAERTGCEVEFEDTTWFDAAGTEHAVWLREDAPTACRVVLVKHSNETGRALRYPAVLRMASYIQTDKGGNPVSQWKVQPEHMLEKCCEAFATRRAFPNDFSGVYLEEEMQGRHEGNGNAEPRQSRKIRAGDIIVSRKGAELMADHAGPAPADDQAPDEIPDREDSPEPVTAQQVNDHFVRLGFTVKDKDDVRAAAAALAGRSSPIESVGELNADELRTVKELLEDLGGRDEAVALWVAITESNGGPAGAAANGREPAKS